MKGREREVISSEMASRKLREMHKRESSDWFVEECCDVFVTVSIDIAHHHDAVLQVKVRREQLVTELEKRVN